MVIDWFSRGANWRVQLGETGETELCICKSNSDQKDDDDGEANATRRSQCNAANGGSWREPSRDNYV